MIHMELVKVIGKKSYRFTFMGENFFSVILESQHLAFNDVYKCGLCGSDKLYLRAYVTEKDKYEYVKIQCAECKASLTFGKTKKDGAFFLRKKDDGSLAWEQYEEKKET